MDSRSVGQTTRKMHNFMLKNSTWPKHKVKWDETITMLDTMPVERDSWLVQKCTDWRAKTITDRVRRERKKLSESEKAISADLH